MRTNQKALAVWRGVAVCGIIGASGWVSAGAQAAPLDAGRVAGDAGVVVHLDVDRLRETKAYEKYLSKLIGEGIGSLPPEIAHFAEEAGVSVADLHDVTAYALSDPNHLLFLVNAKMDPAKVTAAIKKEAGETAEAAYGKYKVLSWGQGEEAVRATFHGDGTLVLARSDDDLHKAIDALDGSADRLKPDSLLAGRAVTATKPAIDAQDRPVLFVGVTQIDKLAKAIDDGDDELPALVKKVTGGWITLGEGGGDIVLRAAVSTTDADSAQTMQQALDGIKAMVQLAAGSDEDAELKVVSDLLRGVSTSRAEKDLSLRIAIPLAKLPEMLKSLDIETDDKAEPGEKHRVRLQVKVGEDKEAKEPKATEKAKGEKQ